MPVSREWINSIRAENQRRFGMAGMGASLLDYVPIAQHAAAPRPLDPRSGVSSVTKSAAAAATEANTGRQIEALESATKTTNYMLYAAGGIAALGVLFAVGSVFLGRGKS